jgi:hypothetical protein
MWEMENRDHQVEERIHLLSQELMDMRCNCGGNKENVPLVLSSNEVTSVSDLLLRGY